MDRPSITVVTVTLNAASLLPLTIESVLDQTYSDIEYLVVDGGSCDATAAVLARYRGLVDRVEVLEDAGVYFAMNAAARLATGQFVLFLNAGDQFYCADAVEAVVERRQGDPDIFYGDHVYVEGRAETLVRAADFRWTRRKLLDGRIDHAWHRAIPCHQATFTRTTLLRSLQYDPRYRICADHEFLFRACDAGASFGYIDETVCHYHSGGLSANAGPLIHREWAHAYRKHSLRPLAVDELFFPTALQSPFVSRTTGSGLLLGGVHEEEAAPGSTGERWHWASGLTIAAPHLAEVTGVEISGLSLHPDQRLTLLSAGKILATHAVGGGAFSVRIGFATPVTPGETITIEPSISMRLSNEDAREAGWGFARLDFLSCPVTEGGGLVIASAGRDLRAAALIEGWEVVDDGVPYARSTVDRTVIAVGASELAAEVSITLLGPPYTSAGQILEVFVNGSPCGALCTGSAPGTSSHRFGVGHAWRRGANVVEFRRVRPEDREPAPFDSEGVPALGLAAIDWRCGA